MSSGTPIRVMLVDDHAVVRTGLKTFLLVYEDLELVAESGSGEKAISLCAQIRPDVVLMDLVMPGMDGPAATRALRAHCPETQVIALTSYKDEALVQQALEAGAIGYLLKDVSADDLAAAIREASRRCDGRARSGTIDSRAFATLRADRGSGSAAGPPRVLGRAPRCPPRGPAPAPPVRGWTSRPRGDA